MSAASIDRKEERFLTQNSQISRRTYNLVLCGTLLYGFIINLILCITVKDVTNSLIPGYFYYYISYSVNSGVLLRLNPIILLSVLLVIIWLLYQSDFFFLLVFISYLVDYLRTLLSMPSWSPPVLLP